MKIEIETNDFLGDETTIRDEVIEIIAEKIMSQIVTGVKELIQQSTKEYLAMVIKEQLSIVVKTHLDTEYVERDSYGRAKEPTTVRNKIADILQKECQFKNTNYSSDQTIFTRIIKDTIEQEMKKFKKDFTSLVNTKLIQECLDTATATLKKACGIK